MGIGTRQQRQCGYQQEATAGADESLIRPRPCPAARSGPREPLVAVGDIVLRPRSIARPAIMITANATSNTVLDEPGQPRGSTATTPKSTAMRQRPAGGVLIAAIALVTPTTSSIAMACLGSAPAT